MHGSMGERGLDVRHCRGGRWWWMGESTHITRGKQIAYSSLQPTSHQIDPISVFLSGKSQFQLFLCVREPHKLLDLIKCLASPTLQTSNVVAVRILSEAFELFQVNEWCVGACQDMKDQLGSRKGTVTIYTKNSTNKR